MQKTRSRGGQYPVTDPSPLIRIRDVEQQSWMCRRRPEQQRVHPPPYRGSFTKPYSIGTSCSHVLWRTCVPGSL